MVKDSKMAVPIEQERKKDRDRQRKKERTKERKKETTTATRDIFFTIPPAAGSSSWMHVPHRSSQKLEIWTF
jgi:hypothetical protein